MPVDFKGYVGGLSRYQRLEAARKFSVISELTLNLAFWLDTPLHHFEVPPNLPEIAKYCLNSRHTYCSLSLMKDSRNS